jgi:hypothetical protein
VTRFEQRTHKGFAQMSRAPCYEDRHPVAIFSQGQLLRSPRLTP